MSKSARVEGNGEVVFEQQTSIEPSNYSRLEKVKYGLIAHLIKITLIRSRINAAANINGLHCTLLHFLMMVV